MGIFNTSLQLFNKFLNNFKPFFSAKQFNVFRLAIYVLFKDYKRNSLWAMAKMAHIDYQKFQYFFSESLWDFQALNHHRINLIQSQRTTASTPEGVLVIDDTSVPKPYAHSTEGAKFQYCGILKREEVCNVAVCSTFSSKSKAFPIDLKFYKPECEFPRLGKKDPEFKSKLDFAEDLIDEALSKKIKFKAVVFDSWYSSANLIKAIHLKKLHFITEVRSNRLFHFLHPVTKLHCWVNEDELVKLIRKHFPTQCKFVHLRDDDHKEQPFLTFSFTSKVTDCSVPLQVLVIFRKWSDQDDKSVHILITNDLAASPKTILSLYRLRWGIERVFQELKDTFCFDHYQVRHQTQILRYWTLCLLAWTLTYWIKQNAYLSKIVEGKPSSFNEFKAALNSLLLYDSTSTLSKNMALSQSYFNIKSNRFKKHYKVAA